MTPMLPYRAVLADNRSVVVLHYKIPKHSTALVLRLFELTGRARKTVVSLPFARMKKTIALGRFQVKTLKVDLKKRTWTEVSPLER